MAPRAPSETRAARSSSPSRRSCTSPVPSTAGADDARGQVAEAPAGAVGRLTTRPPGSADPRRPGSPSPAPRAQLLAQLAQSDAGLDRPPPRRRRSTCASERSTITPSVQAMSVKEWPEPTTLTGPRRPPRGRARLRGRALDPSRAQLLQAQLTKGWGKRGTPPAPRAPSAPPGRSACRAGPPHRAPPCSRCRRRHRLTVARSVRSAGGEDPGQLLGRATWTCLVVEVELLLHELRVGAVADRDEGR